MGQGEIEAYRQDAEALARSRSAQQTATPSRLLGQGHGG